MAEIIEIYGTKISVPLPTANDYVEDWGTDNPKEQYWRRREMPAFFSQVEYDKEGNALLTPQQRAYASEEVRRCKEGFFFKSNGKTLWISGKHYFFLQWWKLEDDIYADFRMADRDYFLFLNHWENVPFCLGIIRGKKRREGATSQATSNLVYECIFFKNSFCGLTSKTQIDAKAAFTNMVSFGYRQLPVFLKPKQLNNKDSVTELVFANKSSNIRDGVGSTIDSDTGHRSRVDYRAPGKNAYDSGRISRILIDEGGKWPVEVPVSEFLAIVSKTMVKGAKRVGWAEMPSTVNEMTKGGGAQFKIVWDLADNFKYQRTPNRFVRYFSPAYDGFVGFIDKWGMSVIDPPTEEQYEYLVENNVGAGDLTEEDIRLGAKEYLLQKRAQLEGTQLEEEIRMNPFTEKEMFQSANTNTLFAAHQFAMREQLDWLSYQSDLLERGNLTWENGHKYYQEIPRSDGGKEIKVSKLVWTPDPNGKFEKVKDWEPMEKNNVLMRNGYFLPNGSFAVAIGCDPFKYDKTKDNRRSNCAVYALQREDHLKPDWEYNDAFVMRYVDRAPTTDIQYEHVLKLAWYCGAQILFERNVDGWKKYLSVEKCSGFAMWLPGEVEPGVYADGAGKGVQMLCELTEAYIARNIRKVYFKELIGEESGWLGFMVEDTQRFDDVMAAGYCLVAARTKKYIQQDPATKNVEDVMPMRRAG
jgi:hypothetical protein